MTVKMKSILYIASFVSVFTYTFWNYFPKGSFYLGNALFIYMLCMYLFLVDRNSKIKFVLFSLSLNNLLDELFFNSTKLGLNELLTASFIFIILIFKKNNDRKRA